MAVTFIICAAGIGSRMRAVHPTLPKPLLLLNGKTMLTHSISCLPLRTGDEVTIVGQTQHRLRRAEAEVLAHVSNAKVNWLDLDHVTSGQLATAALAAEKIPQQNSLAIFNSDSVFECQDLAELMRDREGLIPCSVEDGDEWSFCAVSDESRMPMPVRDVIEKKRISKWCSVGFYWFREKSTFLRLAQEELSDGTRSEHFVAPLYRRYIAESLQIDAVRTDSFKAMGTPDQLSRYWGLSMKDLIEENLRSPFGER